MAKNLQTQIEELRDNFTVRDITMEQFLEIVRQTKFQRGYLPSSFDSNKVNNAIQYVKDCEKLDEEVKKIQQSILEKQNLLKELKPPLLFGKAKYQETIDGYNREIAELNDKAESLLQEIKAKAEERQQSVAFISEYELENANQQKVYDEDESSYLQEKKVIISIITDKLINLPEEVIKGDWEIGLLWFKNFFRTSPETEVFPVIGWERAHEAAVILSSRYDDWKDDSSMIIINGEAMEFRSAAKNLLFKYIENVDDHTDPLHFIVKAITVFFNIVENKDAQFVFGMKDKMPEETLKVMCNTVITTTPFGKMLNDLFKTIQTGKERAIQKQSEAVLNVMIEEENYYNEIFGWLRRYASF